MEVNNRIDPARLIKELSSNKYIQAGGLLLGLAFTISSVMNHHYQIKLNKLKIEQAKKGISVS